MPREHAFPSIFVCVTSGHLPARARARAHSRYTEESEIAHDVSLGRSCICMDVLVLVLRRRNEFDETEDDEPKRGLWFRARARALCRYDSCVLSKSIAPFYGSAR